MCYSDWLWNTGGPSYEAPPGVAEGGSKRCGCSGCYQALGPQNLVVTPVKPYMLSFSSFSHTCSTFLNVIIPSTPTPPTFTLQLFLDSIKFSFLRGSFLPEQTPVPKEALNIENWTGGASDNWLVAFRLDGQISSRPVWETIPLQKGAIIPKTHRQEIDRVNTTKETKRVYQRWTMKIHSAPLTTAYSPLT